MASVCVAIELNLDTHPLHRTETQRMGHVREESANPRPISGPLGRERIKRAAFKERPCVVRAVARRLITHPNEYYGRSLHRFLS
jgi:hypothetical protein